MENQTDQASGKTPVNMEIAYIKGFPFPASARFTKENILSALAYTPLDDDYIISSYPKTGTTWAEYIILQIFYRGKKFPTMVELNHQLIPFMERTGAAAAEKLPSPRFIKYHLPYHLIPYNKNAKYIYVMRSPKDVAVSYYHFRRSMDGDDISFDDFFECFMSGKIPYGDYLEHISSWIHHNEDNNVFFICYEKLCRDTRNEILRIAKFLGEEYYKALKEDDELFNKILEVTSFDYMMKNLVVKRPLPNIKDMETKGSEQKTVKFFRKGQPGDWKNHLSEEQNRRLEKKMKEMLGEGELLDLWLS